jgi:hypothetical protein
MLSMCYDKPFVMVICVLFMTIYVTSIFVLCKARTPISWFETKCQLMQIVTLFIFFMLVSLIITVCTTVLMLSSTFSVSVYTYCINDFLKSRNSSPICLSTDIFIVDLCM